MSNRICQIKLGKKGIQITDLPLFAHLLDVSVDAILSGGKELKLASTRMTNYSVAHSSDESVWKEYVEHPDKLILNCDEYGKSDDKVLDYYSKEFEIKANDGFVFTCVFSYGIDQHKRSPGSFY